MSMPDGRRIGFDRTIAAEWLDAAVARVMTGEATEATRKFLWDFLEDVEPGTTHNSSRGKTLTVLTRIWDDVPKQAAPLKRAALECIAATTGETRIGSALGNGCRHSSIFFRCGYPCRETPQAPWSSQSVAN